jgi:hypothetical protein
LAQYAHTVGGMQTINADAFIVSAFVDALHAG